MAKTCVDQNGAPLPLSPPSECYWWDNPWLPTPVSLVSAIQAHLPARIPVTYIPNVDKAKPYGTYTEDQLVKTVSAAKDAGAVIFVLSKPAREQADLVSLDG